MKSTNKLFSIRESFSETLIDLASENLNLYVVSADLKSSLSLDKFASKFRSRFIECGVAEQNAAGVAAGLARSGKTVFLCSYACFSPSLNWNTIKQSICYNNLPVKIIGSHGGLASADLGATHQMLEDIALMRSLPNMDVFSPADAIETNKIIITIARSPRPAYIRLVRPSTPNFTSSSSFTIGKSQILQTGTKVTILGHGPILHQALEIRNCARMEVPLGEKLEIINCSSIKPLDETTILKSIKKTGRLIVIEDHQKNGGLGEAVAALVLTNNLKCKFTHLAVDNQFGRSAKNYLDLYNLYHIGQKDLELAIKKIL